MSGMSGRGWSILRDTLTLKLSSCGLLKTGLRRLGSPSTGSVHLPMEPGAQLEQVTQHLRLKVTRNGRFAEFVVGELTALLAAENIDSSVVHDPLKKEDGYLEDPSHALVLGLPHPSTDRATEVGAQLARAALLHAPPVKR